MKVFRASGMIWALLALAVCLKSSAHAAQTPNVPDKYKRFFFLYADQRPWYEKALNSIGLTSIPVGRSYALIAGVTQYPNFPSVERELRPAAVDIEKLKSYLKEQEFFDEIVVLKDGDMDLENLNYFLQDYFPDKLHNSPHSRFLFAYSGHGYAEGADEMSRGFLLLSAATTHTDPVNRIDLSIVRALLDPVIENAEKVLVLVNACQSGSFLGRKPFGPANPLTPGDRGAHAIMASRADQRSFGQVPAVGPGSVFFEKIFAGLEGAADTAPRDGVVTYRKLDAYLHQEIPYATGGNQTPMEGDISRNGSVGEFFFLNRSRQVQAGNAKPWNPGNAVAFGTADSDIFERGQLAYASQRYGEAFEAFQQAAQAGNTDAMNSLGLAYLNGRGVAPDPEAARQWYQKAADAGNAEAMVGLGYMYHLAQDEQHARVWYEKAAASGSAMGMYDLGDMYENARGVPQDYLTAKDWYDKAAAAGSSFAMGNLGVLYLKGYGVAQDYQKARQWFDKGANAEDATSMSGLGYLYENALGVPRDYPLARQWYEKAVALGNTNAIYNLGVIYERGYGTEQDYSLARQLYERAAAAGDGDAMFNLGNLYQNGMGVPPDNVKARQLYERAAALGNKLATERLQQVRE